MSDPRILLTTYPEAFLFRGGGELELVEISSCLKLLGFRVDLYGPTSQPLQFYDTVLHFSIVQSGLSLFRTIKSNAKRIVLVPNVWWPDAPNDAERQNAEEYFRLADQIIFKSTSELNNVRQYVTVPEGKEVLCPWGVDRCYSEPVERTLFKSLYELDRYVLWVGIIEPRKNQLTAIHALSDLDIPVVFVGDYRDRRYYEACRSSAPDHFKFIPYLQAKSEVLRSAFQNCDLYLEVPLEPAGMSALEAYIAGRNMVLSDGPWTQEQFGDEVIAVDPRSETAIAGAVSRALSPDFSLPRSGRINRRNLLPECLEPLGRVLAKAPVAARVRLR